MKYFTFIVLFSMFHPILSAKTVAGKVIIKNKDGSIETSCSHSIVFLESDQLEKTSKPEKHTMNLKGRSFDPDILPVSTGSEVLFPNDDVILHNVFSLSKTKKFDLGLYKQGETKSVVFEKPGLVKAFCNIHPEMVGHILVFDHSYYSKVQKDCSYTLKTPPDGTYKISAWYAFGKGSSHEISFEKSNANKKDLLTIQVKKTKKTFPKHKDKNGKRYKKAY